MSEDLALQIFPNLFLGEMGKFNGFRAKKFGFSAFRIPDLPRGPRCAVFVLPEKQPSTIPCFQKQIVVARSLRARPAKPADRSTIISPIEFRSPRPGVEAETPSARIGLILYCIVSTREFV
jgi:hypothetical protein